MGGNFLQTGDPRFVDVASPINVNNTNYPNFQLQTGSPCIDTGVFLTTVSSAGGSETTFQVADPYYFMDGWGIIQGDQIQLQGSTVKARITSVNYSTKTISVDTTVTWTQSQGVALAYSGAAPDAGAFESGSGTASTNVPPSVAAIPARTIPFPTNTVAVAGVATDSNKDALTFTWAQVSGSCPGNILLGHQLEHCCDGICARDLCFSLHGLGWPEQHLSRFHEHICCRSQHNCD